MQAILKDPLRSKKFQKQLHFDVLESNRWSIWSIISEIRSIRSPRCGFGSESFAVSANGKRFTVNCQSNSFRCARLTAVHRLAQLELPIWKIPIPSLSGFLMHSVLAFIFVSILMLSSDRLWFDHFLRIDWFFPWLSNLMLWIDLMLRMDAFRATLSLDGSMRKAFAEASQIKN